MGIGRSVFLNSPPNSSNIFQNTAKEFQSRKPHQILRIHGLICIILECSRVLSLIFAGNPIAYLQTRTNNRELRIILAVKQENTSLYFRSLQADLFVGLAKRRKKLLQVYELPTNLNDIGGGYGPYWANRKKTWTEVRESSHILALSPKLHLWVYRVHFPHPKDNPEILPQALEIT